jgi:hypothetical protein
VWICVSFSFNNYVDVCLNSYYIYLTKRWYIYAVIYRFFHM